MKRSIVLLRDLEAGTILKEEYIGFKRPSNGLPPNMLELVLGTQLAVGMKKDTALQYNSIQWDDIQFKKIGNKDMKLIETFLSLVGSSLNSFRYFNKRLLTVISNHIVTVIIIRDNVPIGYGSLGKDGLFTESTPYAPNSPYSASKASSDLLVRSYFHTYGLNVVTTNCSNNYRSRQHNEKLIPTIISKAIFGQPIPIYGDGMNIRDWLYVLDHAKGIDLAFYRGSSGETYNIGGRNERTNMQILNAICEILDGKKRRADGKSYKEQITFVKDRAGHDRRYAIDASKIESELGWKAEENFESGIMKTVNWYLTSN